MLGQRYPSTILPMREEGSGLTWLL